MEDISPELLEALKNDFRNKFNSSKKIEKLNELLLENKASYKEANEYAIEVGDILAEVFKNNLKAEMLPDNKMYYNIAKKVIEPNLNSNYDLISEYSKVVQSLMNEKSNIGLKAIKPSINQDRIDGIINRISEEDNFEDIKWILYEPVKNFSQSIVDDTIKTNAEFQYKSGLSPKIERKEYGSCCEWCKKMVGEYDYPDVPKDVYRRHRYCRCSVEYINGEKRQNVWSKNTFEGRTERELKEFRIRQIRDIIKSKEEKDKKEILKTQRILKNFLLGEKVNNIEIKNVSFHFAEKIIERNLVANDVIETVKNPLKFSEIKYDNKNRSSFKVIGEKSTVTINPENGNMVTAHKTHSKLIKKIKRELDENNIK